VAEYRLLIKPSAAKEIEAIGTKRDRQRIVGRIQALARDPRPSGCEKLSGPGALFRVLQGQYRVIYTVDDTRHSIEIIKVGHRGEVYRRAP
jgi:mRNA interferase RelE/StbE